MTGNLSMHLMAVTLNTHSILKNIWKTARRS